MNTHVRVCKNVGDPPIALPAEDDSTLLLSTVSAQFPGVIGLKYEKESILYGIKYSEGRLFPPNGSWDMEIVYHCVFPEGNNQERGRSTSTASFVNVSTTLSAYIESTVLNYEFVDERRCIYIECSNIDKNVRDAFRTMLKLLTKHFSENLLVVNGDDRCDLLRIIKENGCSKIEKHHTERAVDLTCGNIDVKVHDHPISIPIYVADEILSQFRRTNTSSSFNVLGTQHVYIAPGTVDISGSSSCDDILNDDAYIPVHKKLKTCSKRKYMELHGELPRHLKNSTEQLGSNVNIDVLLFISSSETRENLAKYLGLIDIEQQVVEANLNADEKIIFQKRAANKKAKLYGLVQAFVSQKLMLGCHNICLTSNYQFFINIGANVKGSILQKNECKMYPDLDSYVNYSLILPNNSNVFAFISAVSKICSKILKVGAGIETIVCVKCMSEVENEFNENYYKISLPFLSVIPFYILRYFAQVILSEQIDNSSFDSLYK